MRLVVPVASHQSVGTLRSWSRAVATFARHRIARARLPRLTLAIPATIVTVASVVTVTPLGAQVRTTAVDTSGAAPTDPAWRTAATTALDRLVDVAARRNVLPDSLQAYRALVESEITLVIRRADGTEVVGSVEQVASRLRWARTGVYEQRIVGHRMQQLGANPSMLTIFERGFVQPLLYGNRLRIVEGPPETGDQAGAPTATDSARAARRARRRRAGADTVTAIHPLATDRVPWYRYTGGDTVVTIRDGERRITVVRVHAAPRDTVPGRAVLFEGDLDLDAERGVIVRMRGRFVRVGPSPARGLLGRALVGAVDAVGFLDYENAEWARAYWLPTTQRIELQAAAPVFGEGRAVFRIVSRVEDIVLNDTLLDEADVARADAVRAARLAGKALPDSAPVPTGRRLAFAPADSLAAWDGWRREPGVLSEGLHADDFDDVGPDRWRTVGPPRVDWGVPFFSDLLRYNRVEGVFTGFGVRASLRDLAPGTTLRATAGWAWGGEAVRGRVEARRDWVRTAGSSAVVLRAGRQLDLTNDFRTPIDSGGTLAALSGQDEYDYVDRTFVALDHVRMAGDRGWQLRLEAGLVRDEGVAAVTDRTPVGGLAFRLNRHVDAGDYGRVAATWVWRPDAQAEFLRSGVSARLHAEGGMGDLDYGRLEGRLAARRTRGPFIFVARADAGLLLGADPPTQQLFELGRTQGLPGYPYKAFAGTRAVNVRSLALWNGPWWRAPVRIGGLVLPAFAPGASVGVYGGMTAAPGAAARDAVARLGERTGEDGLRRPVATVSDGWRTSAVAGLRFFSGTVFVGAARPLDGRRPWQWLLTVGQQL